MDKQTLERKLKFIDEYKKAKNASTGSKVDSNANVISKNVATLQTELGKKDLIDLNRAITCVFLDKLYGEGYLTEHFLNDLKNHIIYSHDETSIFPYCCSISLYPYLLNGLKDLGGTSMAPQHANSFIGGMINLVFLVAGQFAGAVAIPEFLTYFDHFLRIDYGEDYIDHLDEVVEKIGKSEFTLRHKIEDWFQQFVYSVNQPAGARNYQSPFTNIAYFDKYYFESIFKDFFFPDGDEPKWETVNKLQKLFMKWFNKERTKDILTFPVETANILVEDGKYKDEENADFFAEMWEEGHSFFMYQSDSVDALASCCRLRNAVEDNIFSYTLGAGGIETGSKKVITLNINRIVQDWYKVKDSMTLVDYINPIINRVHAYLSAWNEWLWDLYNDDMLTVYKAGFIDLDKQYLTVGINGFVEAAEFLATKEDTDYCGIEIDPNNEQYQKLAKDILETIKERNQEHRSAHCKFNTEFVPAENLGIKNYKWDKKDGYMVPADRECYNSYFYKVEDRACDILTKFYLQGTNFTGCLDGGSAYHCNLEENLSKKQYRLLMDVAVDAGCNYFTFNVPQSICEDCGKIYKHKVDVCPECGSHKITYATRIIGYLKPVKHWSETRQQEFASRFFSKGDEIK